MLQPEVSQHKKADEIGDKVGELKEQVGRQLRVGDPGNLRTFEIQHEQRQRNRVQAVRDGAQPVMCARLSETGALPS